MAEVDAELATEAEKSAEIVTEGAENAEIHAEPVKPDGLEVARRKEYEKRVEAEARERVTRERLSALEQENQALKAGNVSQKPISLAELDEALKEGRVTPAEVANYLAEQKAKEVYAASEKRRVDSESQSRPLIAASTEVAEYIKLVPGLTDGSEVRFGELQEAANELQSKLGIAQGPVLDMLALRQVYGGLDGLKRKASVRSATRILAGGSAGVGSGAGGGVELSPTTDADIVAKAPKHFKDAWARRGTTPKEQAVEAKIYFQQKAKRAKK